MNNNYSERMVLHGFQAQLERQRQLFQTANSREGQRPQRKVSRLELDLLFRGDNEQPFLGYHFRQTFNGYAYPPCTTALAELKPMFLDDLRLETHHRGYVLIVRIFGHPTEFQCVQNGVEDGQGGVERLAVYNWDPTMQSSQILPRGKLVAIKEPYYKMTGDGMPTIQVDHPTDLVGLEKDHELIPVDWQLSLVDLSTQSALSLKDNGNVAFKAKKYVDAVEQYSHALRICDRDDLLTLADLHRNRAIANLYLKRYEKALLDAKAAVITHCERVDVDPSKVNLKAFYRAGCASYHLNDFEQAKDFFQKVIDIEPSDADARREIHRTNQRLLEQLEGRYDFEAMSNSMTKKYERLDHASYTAKVAIRDTADRGKGLFAVNPIKAGELIFCEKAFTVAYDNDNDRNISTIVNLTRGTVHRGAHADRLIHTVHKLIQNPEQATKFLRLYDGDYNPKTSELVQDGLLAVDAFRVQTILEYNSFSCPSKSSLDQGNSPSHSTGIWLTASYANHDCVANADRAFIGDMMIVSANTDIKRDQEITMQYRSPEADPNAFQHTLQKAWKFKCTCVLCQAEAKTPTDQIRRRIDAMKQVNQFLQSPSNQLKHGEPPPALAIVRTAEGLYEEVKSTYDHELFRDLPRPMLSDLDAWLCGAYGLTHPEKLLDQALTLLRNNGFMVTVKEDDITIDRNHCRIEGDCIDGAICAATVFDNQGQTKASRKLRELAMQLWKIAYGTKFRFDQLLAED